MEVPSLAGIPHQRGLGERGRVDPAHLRPGPAHQALLPRGRLPDVARRARRGEPEEERAGLRGRELEAAGHALGKLPGAELAAPRLEEVEAAGPVRIHRECHAGAVLRHRQALDVPAQRAGERARRRRRIGELEPVELAEVALPVGDEVDRLPVARRSAPPPPRPFPWKGSAPAGSRRRRPPGTGRSRRWSGSAGPAAGFRPARSRPAARFPRPRRGVGPLPGRAVSAT